MCVLFYDVKPVGVSPFHVIIMACYYGSFGAMRVFGWLRVCVV